MPALHEIALLLAQKDRCHNPNHPAWNYYGGRGIAIDPRWESFENFLTDMGERPEGTTLDRFVHERDFKSMCDRSGSSACRMARARAERDAAS